ncbi:hypothetical protein ASPCADRAFT_398607 [Aspergillus carbonarius ITEM 5010]|uniref:Protein kinase domain-containing protein n=1 Tax=Aspergillus carbonarius (strain ITEM 5010) TaxID=602072 RepID=A0A1R3RGM2_ASPC5|nr:hypothetical protein ASPCADRAFT_398607 [Aspergillus carbonarius ITEM 5010]
MQNNTLTDALTIDPDTLQICQSLRHSEASSIYEVKLHNNRYCLKVYHNNGDPGYSRKGRDLNRFRCELKAYRNLQQSGVCEKGLNQPTAILLEYLLDAEELNCVNYSERQFQRVMEGLDDIHRAGVLHYDVYPKNILIVRGPPERVVWIDFDVAMSYSDAEPMDHRAQEYCKFETDLASSFGDLLREDQKQGLLPNTKYY